jgi:uncharacterized membrane protein
MAAFIFIIGLLQIIGGLLTFFEAASAIHQILAALAFGLGMLCIGLAGVIGRLTDIRDIMDKQLAIFDRHSGKQDVQK